MAEKPYLGELARIANSAWRNRTGVKGNRSALSFAENATANEQPIITGTIDDWYDRVEGRMVGPVRSAPVFDVPWKQTASRKAFPLVCPQYEDVDFDVDIAGELSRLARFTGDIRGGAYSIAQHSVVGADVIMAETGNREMAAAFVLHDAHEGPLGDWATPAQQVLSLYLKIILREHGVLVGGADLFKIAMKRLKNDLDAVIYGAAGIIWPLSQEVADAVHIMDLRMLAAEVDAFMGGEVAPWAALVEIRQRYSIPDLRPIGIWPAEVAETRFQEALRRYLPARFPHPAFSIED